MVCYRRHGHNEGDDPSYTQPLMYKRIDARRSVRKLYTEALVQAGRHHARGGRGRARRLPAPAAGRARRDPLARAARGRLSATPPPPPLGVLPHVDTGVAREALDAIFDALDTVPDGLHRPPEAGQAVRGPRRRCSPTARSTGRSAEAMAFGSLLLEGTVGPPAGPGHPPRHVLASATRCSSTTRPARSTRRSRHLGRRQGPVLDLRLAAVGVRRARLRVRLLGRQQGRARHLGGAVRRLHQRRPDHHRPVPRGRRGQVGPDVGPRAAAAPRLRGPGPRALARPASSASSRCAPRTTSRSCNATTAAQYFHLLRRQMRRDVRKPLIVFTPKSLLRAKSSRSPVDELDARLVRGGARRSRRRPTPPAVKRVVFASGKVALRRASPTRDELGAPGRHRPRRAAVPVAVRRASPRCSPRYPNADEIVWLQEEPENMGPWNFVKGRLYEAHGDHPLDPPGQPLRVRLAPPPAPTPSTSRSRKRSSPQIFEGLDPSA